MQPRNGGLRARSGAPRNASCTLLLDVGCVESQLATIETGSIHGDDDDDEEEGYSAPLLNGTHHKFSSLKEHLIGRLLGVTWSTSIASISLLLLACVHVYTQMGKSCNKPEPMTTCTLQGLWCRRCSRSSKDCVTGGGGGGEDNRSNTESRDTINTL
ncbi:hypothetical protein EYF80_050438 [Liparis tanakae]|uniref:Uncharacterized protein n=1 Tax=Liparis tanakae TaxID=230148 RepID=A0A4Z2FDZ5_9TELE|nr:hypothetical protein EYF80_050438 [Liparis tanakae]